MIIVNKFMFIIYLFALQLSDVAFSICLNIGLNKLLENSHCDFLSSKGLVLNLKCVIMAMLVKTI